MKKIILMGIMIVGVVVLNKEVVSATSDVTSTGDPMPWIYTCSKPELKNRIIVNADNTMTEVCAGGLGTVGITSPRATFGENGIAYDMVGPSSVGQTFVFEVKKSGIGTVGTITIVVEQAEAPKTEEPKIEAPKTEEPKIETPKTEVPKTEVPKTEVPKTEVPKTETPKTETPKTEVPKTETPKTETPKTEVPKTENPTVDDVENTDSLIPLIAPTFKEVDGRLTIDHENEIGVIQLSYDNEIFETYTDFINSSDITESTVIYARVYDEENDRYSDVTEYEVVVDLKEEITPKKNHAMIFVVGGGISFGGFALYYVYTKKKKKIQLITN